MHLVKDSPIVVTKAQYTAEEFIQKKIELLVSAFEHAERYVELDASLHAFSRKMKSNRSTLSTWKTSATNISVG